MRPRPFYLIFFFFYAPVLFAQTTSQTPSAEFKAEDFYHQALNAYLDGNYDQAIVLTAQSLGEEPSYAKSKNLLSILTVEKDQEGKTVIWLAGKPSIVIPTPIAQNSRIFQEPSGLEKQVQTLQKRLGNFYTSQTYKNAETNSQIQVIQELIKNSSKNEYEELKISQLQIYKQLERIASNHDRDLLLLFLLCFTSLGFSIVAILRKNKKHNRL
ncbi:MAG TPA: hypothetical protein VIJ93_00520 [bacterium]